MRSSGICRAAYTVTAMEEVSIERMDLRLSSLRLGSPAEIARLRASVEREGIRHPVLASIGIERDAAVLIDGFKRVRVAKDLGIVLVAATLMPLDGPASKAAMLRCNAPHRGLSDVEEAWIVRSLCREHGMTQDAVGQMLGRDQSWVSRRLKLADHLEQALQDDLRLGLLSSATARELARLPRGEQIASARAVRDHGLSSRQAAHLVSTLSGTDDRDARREVLADPLRYLLAVHPETRTADPRLGIGGNDIRQNLLFFESAAARLWRSLERHAPTGLCSEEARVLLPLVGQALRAGRRTVIQLEQLSVSSAPPSPPMADPRHA